STPVAVGTLPATSGVGSLTLQPSTVAGGGTALATITLSSPAPAGGASVAITTTNATLAPVPATVVVPAGQTTGSFSITTLSVATTQSVTLTAAYAGTTAPATLAIVHDANPPAV